MPALAACDMHAAYAAPRGQRRQGSSSTNSAPPPGAFAACTAAVLLSHLTHDRQAQSRAGPPARRRPAVEAIEQVREVLGRDAAAVVAHPHAAHAGGDLHHAARRRMAGGVVEQVVDRAREPLARPVDHRRLQRDSNRTPGACRWARASASRTR